MVIVGEHSSFFKMAPVRISLDRIRSICHTLRMETYTVKADVEYLDGNLAGILMENQYRVRYSRMEDAVAAARRLRKFRTFTAAVTHNQYVLHNVSVVEE